jgi:hypothetical protein
MESMNGRAGIAARLERLVSEIRDGNEITVQQLSAIGEILSNLRIDEVPQSAQHIHDMGKTTALLMRLTLGDLPPGLHSEVASIWTANESRWLTQTAYHELRSQITEAMRDVRKVDEETGRLEGDIRLRQQRLETLTALADLLDALTGQMPANPSLETS